MPRWRLPCAFPRGLKALPPRRAHFAGDEIAAKPRKGADVIDGFLEVVVAVRLFRIAQDRVPDLGVFPLDLAFEPPAPVSRPCGDFRRRSAHSINVSRYRS